MLTAGRSFATVDEAVFGALLRPGMPYYIHGWLEVVDTMPDCPSYATEKMAFADSEEYHDMARKLDDRPDLQPAWMLDY